MFFLVRGSHLAIQSFAIPRVEQVFFAIFVFSLAMYGIVKDTKIIFVLTEKKNASVDFMRQIRLNIDLCYYVPGRLIFLPPYSH